MLLLVADAATGQQAVNVAQTFDRAVNVTGIVLTVALALLVDAVVVLGGRLLLPLTRPAREERDHASTPEAVTA